MKTSSTSVTKVIRVLIADDHPVVREGLVTILKSEKDIIVVAEAADGKETCELYHELAPDVLLLGGETAEGNRAGFGIPEQGRLVGQCLALSCGQIAAGGETGANPMASTHGGWIHRDLRWCILQKAGMYGLRAELGLRRGEGFRRISYGRRRIVP